MIRNEITEFLDTMIVGTNDYYKSYILDEVYKNGMAIRIPGITIGELSVDSELKVTGFEFYKDIKNYFTKDNIENEMKEFIGFKIK